jgi:hypothetical protein
VTPFILLDTNDRRRGLSMVSGREDEEFMKLGVQYYVAARSAVMAQLLPVCGNLYHHSLEITAFRRKITIDTQRRSS